MPWRLGRALAFQSAPGSDAGGKVDALSIDQLPVGFQSAPGSDAGGKINPAWYTES